MLIAQRLRKIREEKGLSQDDVEHASGLPRDYIARVEGGYTVPSLETLRRFANALDVPLYRLFHTADEPPTTPHLRARLSLEELAGEDGPSGNQARLSNLRGLIGG